MTDWTQQEFKAYLLLYASQSDMIESAEEKDFILSRVPVETYNKIHAEFDEDNDYQSIQKIMHNCRRYKYNEKGMEQLMADIKEIFMADGEYDTMERNMIRILAKLIC